MQITGTMSSSRGKKESDSENPTGPSSELLPKTVLLKSPNAKNKGYRGKGESSKKQETKTNESPIKEQDSKKSSKEKSTVENKDDENYNIWPTVIAIHVLVYGVSILMPIIYTSFESDNKPTQTVNSSSNPQIDHIENFKKEFKDLKSKFIAQDADFWKRIKVPVLRVIKDEEPDYPAIVLLVVPKGESTSKTATCFAKRYRSIINKVYTGEEKLEKGYIDVQTISEQKSSVEDFKYVLDHKIKELFNSTKPEVHTVVIDHIEALDPNVMLLFHGYCDGDHAPYKKAMFVFVLHTDLETEIASEDLDKTVDHHLLTLWEKNLDKDKIPPLIARVANNKALIQEEHISSLTMSGC